MKLKYPEDLKFDICVNGIKRKTLNIYDLNAILRKRYTKIFGDVNPEDIGIIPRIEKGGRR